MGKTKWVDLKAVRELVAIAEVLEHYGATERLAEKGEQLVGCCPIHQGKEAKKHFSANTKRNIFQCFYCKAKGGVLDLVVAMEGIDAGRNGPREAGLLLVEWFPERFGDHASEEVGGTQGPPEAAQGRQEEEQPSEDLVNAPLKPDFRVQRDANYVYLRDRGLTGETVEAFELGYVARESRSMHRNRIAWPIHDETGEHTLAYAGRWVESEEELPEGEGKYKLPAGFHKSLVLYNYHRVPDDSKEVIVVEGFFSVFWLTQNGWPNVVSTMGSMLSERQLDLLARRFKGVKLFLDGDTAGREASGAMCLQLAPRLYTRVCNCPNGLQPDRLPAHELAGCLK